MTRAIEKIKEEFLKMLPPTIYFFIALHIVAFLRAGGTESRPWGWCDHVQQNRPTVLCFQR